jgi:hypothetical protein
MVGQDSVQVLQVHDCFMLVVAVAAHNLYHRDLVLREVEMDANHQHQFRLWQERPTRAVAVVAVVIPLVELLLIFLMVLLAALASSSFDIRLTAPLLLLQQATLKSTTLMATKSTLGHHLEL